MSQQPQPETNPYSSFIESLIKFLSKHYAKQIMKQIPKVVSHLQMIDVELQFDLNLLHDQEPLIGRWIIEFYPSFYKALQRSVYEVIQRSTLIHYQEYEYMKNVTLDIILCQPKFINVPLFNTPIHDPLYKTQVLEKSVGSLVHLKNCIIISANQSELYLASQYYRTECGCQGKGFLQINHLIHLLRHNYSNKRNNDKNKLCPMCGVPMRELIEQRKYQPCQELKVHLNDMTHTNQKKYSNFCDHKQTKQIPLTNDLAIRQSQKNEESFMIVVGGDQLHDTNLQFIKNRKYKLDKYQTYSVFVIGTDVGKYKQGQELHVIAYYCFNVANQPEARFVKIAQEYFIAIQINLVNYLMNRNFFSTFPSVAGFQPTFSQYSTSPNNQLYDLIERSHKHFQHTKDNLLLQYEIWQILLHLSNNVDGLFPLKISLLMSVFWKNRHNISYHCAYNQNKQSNIEINHNAHTETTNKIDVCVIHEDDDVMQDTINQITQGMEDVYYFPVDADDLSLNQFCMSLIKGGLLIVRYTSKIKKQHLDLIRQILIGNAIQLEKNSKIKLNCTVWMLIPIVEIYQEKKNAKEIVTIQNSGRLSDFKNLFDVVLDLSFINNRLKQVTNDYYLDHSDQVMSKYCEQGDNLLVIAPTEINQTSQKRKPILCSDLNPTNKKPLLMNYDKVASVSSCHLVEDNQNFRSSNLTNDQFLSTLIIQNNESLNLLQNYFHKFREEKSVGGGFLNQSYKIAQASALIRYFAYCNVNDRDSLYRMMLQQNNQPILITYADVFLSVLLATETRINTFGFSQGIFGSETSNYLFNSHKPQYSTIDYEEEKCSVGDYRFKEFKKIYSKIINI